MVFNFPIEMTQIDTGQDAHGLNFFCFGPVPKYGIQNANLSNITLSLEFPISCGLHFCGS